MDFEGVDLDEAMNAVINDMGKAAHDFKRQKYAPKPKAKLGSEADDAQAPKLEIRNDGPTLEELESMLGGG